MHWFQPRTTRLVIVNYFLHIWIKHHTPMIDFNQTVFIFSFGRVIFIIWDKEVIGEMGGAILN